MREKEEICGEGMGINHSRWGLEWLRLQEEGVWGLELEVVNGEGNWG